MRKRMKRCIAALLAAALVCSLGFSVLAESGSIQPTSTAVPTGSSDAADVSSSVPPTEPESTPLPESTPASSAAPSETPLPSETPGTVETPAPTETPQATATPEPTPTPAETPAPSATPEPGETPAPTATPAPAFEKLEVTDTTGAVQAEVGDEVEFSVELNRDDVEVAYQWQVLDTAPGQEEQPEAIYDYGEGESTDYFFPLEDMTEEELLAQNPGATWPGIEMYYALRDSQVSTFSTRSASAEPPRIENGTPNFVLNPEETDVEAGEIAWRDIDGETKASYVHTVTEGEEHLSYRCIVTVTDEEYLAEAQQAAQSAAEGAEPQESEAGEEVPTEAENAENGPSSVPESAPENTVPEKEETSAPGEAEQPASESTAEGLAEESIITETMHIEVPAQPEEGQPEEEPQGLMAGLFSLFRANGTAPDVKLSEDNQWLVGMDTTMEYITANTYEEQDASAANNPYWTKIAGGTRPDGTKYAPTSLVDGNMMEVLSAWYGKTVYVRIAGNSGKGTAIEIPAYTGIDYQTGQSVLYKKAVRVLNAWVPNTGRSFYNAFLRTALNDGWAADDCHITVDTVPTDTFNKVPLSYLTNAEGDYIYDLFIWGSATMEIPDLSGAAAWALQDYLAKGYGFMIGHDMMYHYGGVAGEGYVPDPNDTTTPYYQLNTDMAGSWNMNWLMGQNEMYDVANPYDAASMILCCGNWHDKTPLYGDDSGSSTLRVVTRTEGDPFTSVAARCPTNYPYKLLENIVTHDATCIMAYESYAASHRALLQHYAKRPEVLEEKMSEWRHDFFHPIKGGDTTRHNLILKAALSLSPSLEVEPDTKKYFQVNPACPHSEDTARKTAAEYLYGSHKVPATKGYAALESLSKSKTGSTSSWALYYMAKMRLYGIGTTRNYEEALRLFAQSQQAGNEYAEQALRTARQEHIVYHAKSALAITRTLIRQLAQNMSQTTTQNHTMGLTRHQKLRRAMKHKKELHEPLYP